MLRSDLMSWVELLWMLQYVSISRISIYLRDRRVDVVLCLLRACS